MPRYAEVEGMGTFEFPDDTPDEVIEATVWRETAPARKAWLEKQAEAERRIGREIDRINRIRDVQIALTEGLTAGGLATTAGKILNYAGDVAAGSMEDLIAGERTPTSIGNLPNPLGQRFSAAVMGEKGAPSGADTPIEQGIVDAARTVPAVAAGAVMTAAGIPAPLAFGAPMAAGAYEEAKDQGAGDNEAGLAALQAGATGAVIPGVARAGAQTAARAIAKAVESGVVSAGRTTTQKVAEILAGQGAVQAFMEGLNVPAYVNASPEERRDMFVRSLAGNLAFLGLDAATLVSRTPSATQQRLGPEKLAALQAAEQLVKAANDPAVSDILLQNVDDTLFDQATGIDWAREFIPRDEPEVPREPPVLAEPARADAAATVGTEQRPATKRRPPVPGEAAPEATEPPVLEASPAPAPGRGTMGRSAQAYPGGPLGEGPVPTADNRDFTVFPVEMPEAVRFARDLMGGSYPKIRERLRALKGGALGVFKHQDQAKKASIELRADLFDLVPDAEKAEFRAQAQEYAQKVAEEGDNPEAIAQERFDFLMEEAKKRNPLMAMKVIWHEIGHLVDWLPQHMIQGRGNLLGRIASLKGWLKNTITEKPPESFLTASDMGRIKRAAERAAGDRPVTGSTADIKAWRDLVAEERKRLTTAELAARGMVHLDTLKGELEPLIAWWRGTPKMESYFTGSAEMYAEAFSVFMNNPAAVAKRAPTFYRMLQNYMERKPEVKALYGQIQNQIKSGTVMRQRVEELRGSWNHDNAISMTRAQERLKTSARDFLDNVEYHFDRRFGPVYRRARGTESEASVKQAIGNFTYRAAEHERFLGRMNNQVGALLMGHNLDWNDLGELMFHERVVHERHNLANPMGWTSKNSLERLAEMEQSMPRERWIVLTEASRRFRALYEDQVIPLMKEARLWGPELQAKIDENVWYSTFSAVRGLPDAGIERALELSFGPSVTPHIYRQIGMLGEIKNPATATVLKSLSLMSAAHRNIAKREIVQMMLKSHPEEIKEAERRWTGKRWEYVEQNTDRVGTITYLDEGKPKSYYVPKLVAEATNFGPTVENRLAATLTGALNWQKSLFTQLNYGFWPVNFVRDTGGFWLNMPGLATPLHWAKYFPRALAASRATVKGKFNADADAALKRLMLIARDDPRGVMSDARDEYELKVASYGLNPAQWNKELQGARRAVGLWNRYREIGQTLERVNKIAGMLYLDEQHPNMPEWQKQETVRSLAGSPDFLEKGASTWQADLVMMFYNAWKQGIRSTVMAARANPFSFATKGLVGIAVPAVVMSAANQGLLGQEAEEMYRSVSDRDLTNYLVVPLGWQDKVKRKVAYLRLPLPDPLRILHGSIFRTLTGRGEGYLAYWGGEVPGMNPMIKAAGAWMQYALGQNPYDTHFGRPILDETTFTAGGAQSHQEMLKWTWNTMGGGILHRFQNPQLENPPTSTAENFLRVPGINNVLGRWIKVSNRGLNDELRRVTAPVEKYQAQVRQAVRKTAERWAEAGLFDETAAALGRGDVMDAARRVVQTELNDAERELLRDPYAMDYLLRMLPDRLEARAHPIAKVLNNAGKAEKAAIIQHLTERPLPPVGQ